MNGPGRSARTCRSSSSGTHASRTSTSARRALPASDGPALEPGDPADRPPEWRGGEAVDRVGWDDARRPRARRGVRLAALPLDHPLAAREVADLLEAQTQLGRAAPVLAHLEHEPPAGAQDRPAPWATASVSPCRRARPAAPSRAPPARALTLVGRTYGGLETTRSNGPPEPGHEVPLEEVDAVVEPGRSRFPGRRARARRARGRVPTTRAPGMLVGDGERDRARAGADVEERAAPRARDSARGRARRPISVSGRGMSARGSTFSVEPAEAPLAEQYRSGSRVARRSTSSRGPLAPPRRARRSCSRESNGATPRTSATRSSASIRGPPARPPAEELLDLRQPPAHLRPPRSRGRGAAPRRRAPRSARRARPRGSGRAGAASA